MRIAVVGAGRVGTTLGRRWASLGHAITYVVRDADRHAALRDHGAVVDGPAAPADTAVILLAVPGLAVASVCAELAPAAGTVVVDATNPLATGTRELDGGVERSGGETVARLLPGARVVKAFNTTGSANMADPDYGAARPWMPVAGDDPDAVGVVTDLAAALGFDALHVGPLAVARDLEHLAALWIRLCYPLGHGPGIAFALLRRRVPR